jgi:hypothetical protein
LADELGEPGHAVGVRDVQPVPEVVPERDGELGAGFQQAEEGVAGLLAGGGAGLAGDPAFDDEAADVVLRAVGVQRDVWPVEHKQQLVLVGKGPGDGLVELGKAGDPGEDPIEAPPQRCSADGCRVVLVELEISVEPPDQLALQRDQAVLLVGDADDPAEMALGVDPTCDRLSPGKEDDVKTI